jgi:hypothetical protein
MIEQLTFEGSTNTVKLALLRHEAAPLTAGPKAGREKEEHWDEHYTNSTENPKHTQQTN